MNARVQQLYTRIINQDKARFLFSPYSSGLVATAAIVSEQYGRIMLTTGAAEEKTYRLGNKNLFQMYSSADLYLAGAVQVVKELNPKAEVALVYKDDPFSKAVLQSARKQVADAGLKTALDEAYSPETTDFGADHQQGRSPPRRTFCWAAATMPMARRWPGSSMTIRQG